MNDDPTPAPKDCPLCKHWDEMKDKFPPPEKGTAEVF